jgi:DNA mismatch endonuclease (patch repair protein)
MSDIFTKAKRSEVMSRIRGRGNKATELALAQLFRRHHITGWRRQVEICGKAVASVYDRRPLCLPRSGAHRAPLQKTFRVRPDFVFRRVRLAVFVDGCFWHGCPKHATQPKNNRAFWRRKFSANKQRDALVTRTLRRRGWRVLRIWEHTLRWATMKPQNEARLVRRIQRAVDCD